MFIILLCFIYFCLTSGNHISISSNIRQNVVETIILDNFEYSFYNYRVTWEEAKVFCLGYKSQLATLDSEKKAFFITRQASESSLAHEEFWIGSKKNVLGYWMWTMTNRKLMPNQLLQEMAVKPHYLNPSSEDEAYCLTIFRRNHNIPMFVPLRCAQTRPFICEKENPSFDASIANSFSITVDNQIFVFFPAKLTWSQSVVQCRQEGLQIAEVSSSKQAQILAMHMLRTRPRAIETAWIGGHLKNGVWQWLSTGIDVTHTEMWRNDTTTFGDCLVLDRHTCKNASYLRAKCDRKLNFLCQAPLVKKLNIEPIAVTVDTSQYLIGSDSLNWFEASQSCNKYNASLVVLDSPTKIEHIMDIMIDNSEQLQHIWIDGRRQEKKESGGFGRGIDKETWNWESAGTPIPGPGESFLPWCDDCGNEKYGHCLNMDREDFNVPLVYGLDCSVQQKYICELWTSSYDNVEKLIDQEKIITNEGISSENKKAPLTPLISSEIKKTPVTPLIPSENEKTPLTTIEYQTTAESITRRVGSNGKHDFTFTTPHIDVSDYDEISDFTSTTPRNDDSDYDEISDFSSTTPRIDVSDYDEISDFSSTTPRIDVSDYDELSDYTSATSTARSNVDDELFSETRHKSLHHATKKKGHQLRHHIGRSRPHHKDSTLFSASLKRKTERHPINVLMDHVLKTIDHTREHRRRKPLVKFKVKDMINIQV